MDHPLATVATSFAILMSTGVSIKKLRFHYAHRYLPMCLARPFSFFFVNVASIQGLGVQSLVGPTQAQRDFYHHNDYKIQIPFIVLRIPI